jgi:Zn-dependent M28 family amino/carboxypeptidase
LKVIVSVGVVVFVLLLLFSAGLRKTAYRDGSQVANQVGARSAFDGRRAFADLERICALGPRPPGSPEAEQTRAIIRQELEAVGIPVKEFPFEADTPLGKRQMVNVTGIVEGTRDGVIILGNHYDTKYFPEFRFIGANDAGSTTAWMIEMGRALGPKREGRSIWLVWFDGEEALREWSDADSLYGSREYVRRLRLDRKLESVDVMINVDMIGDRYLGVLRDTGAPGWLSNLIWTTAAGLGHSGHFLARGTVIQDDHMPFRIAGVPAINLIDFEYGGSRLDHSNLWHTPNDTIEHVSADSLQVIGDVIYHALPELDAYLNGRARN